MHVDVVSVCIETPIEDQRSVHETAWVDETATFSDRHLLHVKHEAAVEDLESQGRLASEDHDFVLCDLVGQAHVGRHPLGLIHQRCRDLLPHVARDVVALDGVHDLLLVNTAAERKHVVVLEGAERDTRARHPHLVNDLPRVLLGVVLLALPVDLVVDEGTNDVDETLNGAHTVVSVGVVHVRYRDESAKDLIVEVAALEVHIHVLDVASSKVNLPGLSRDTAGVQRHLVLHRDLLLLKSARLDAVELTASLVPLEGMQAVGQLLAEGTLDVVVNSEVALHQILEISHDLVGVLVEKSLQLAHFLVVVEVLFVLSI